MRDWDDHRLILTLHRHGTLRAAGEALGVTHTTIARRLAALQARESNALFTRHARAYHATDYGLERVALAERIEELDFVATRIQRRSGDGLSGPVSLSIPPAVLEYLLLDDIGTFTAAHPDIELTLTGTDQLADLDRGEADVVIRGHASPPEHLIGREICKVGASFYARRDYMENTAPENRRWISSRPHAEFIKTSPYPDYPIGLVAHDIRSRFLALCNGQGLAGTACFMGDPHPDLIRIDEAPARPLYGLWVLTHPDLRNSPRIKALMKAMGAALSRQKDVIRGKT